MVSGQGNWDFGENPQTQLFVKVALRLADGSMQEIEALIDTGTQVNLLRRGLVPKGFFGPSLFPKRFTTASKKIMEGGLTDLHCSMLMWGVDVDTCERALVERPVIFYDADLGTEALISYEWLQKNNVDVCCRRHGLQINGMGAPKWVSGVVRPPRVRGGVQSIWWRGW